MVAIPGRGYSLDSTEVTNDAYRAFILANPEWQKDRIKASLHDGDYLKDWTGNDYPDGMGSHPVVYVSWHAAQAYAQWAGKRLPRDEEWDFASRAGTSSAYWWGETFDTGHANLNGRGTEPVNQPGRTNPFGLADMSGNVWEWTSTPAAASSGSAGHVVRGGSWQDKARHLRSDSREVLAATVTGPDLGFRCAK